jgi:hypothetical protein
VGPFGYRFSGESVAKLGPFSSKGVAQVGRVQAMRQALPEPRVAVGPHRRERLP